MEHFEKRWIKVGGHHSYGGTGSGNFSIKTDEGKNRWYIASVDGGFNLDLDGAKTAQRICDYHNLVVPALKEAAEFLGHLGFRNEAVEQALRAIGAEATTDKCQDHASDERRA